MGKPRITPGADMVLISLAALALSVPAVSSDVMAHQPAANIAVAPTGEPVNPIATLPAQTIRRSADGLFYVEAEANGQSIRFVVDTGATVVVLNRTDAAKLGIVFDDLASRSSMRTAGGASDMRWAKVERLEMGGKRIEKINVAVVADGLPVSLMGQNALEQLGTVTLRGDTLTIH